MVKGKGKSARVVASQSPRGGASPGGTTSSVGAATGGTSPSSGSPPSSGGVPPSGARPSANSVGQPSRAPARKTRQLPRRETLLGWKPAKYEHFGMQHSPISTRAEFDELQATYGTPEEIQEKIEDTARSAGVPEEEIALFREMHSPETFRKRWKPVDDPDGTLRRQTIPREVMAARSLVVSALGSSPTGLYGSVNGVETLEKHRRYCSRINPWGPRLAVNERAGLTSQTTREQLDPVADAVYGFNGRPLGPGRAALKLGISRARVEERLDEIVDETGFSRQEMSRSAALTNGRRYLWPDEKDLSLGRDDKPDDDTDDMDAEPDDDS